MKNTYKQPLVDANWVLMNKPSARPTATQLAAIVKLLLAVSPLELQESQCMSGVWVKGAYFVPGALISTNSALYCSLCKHI